MKTKLTRGYRRFKNGELATFANHVNMKMTGNTNFPTPIPPLPDYLAAIEAYETACANYERGSKVLGSVREQAKEALLGMLDRMANYVELTADFEYTLLITSGFDLVKEPTSHPIPSIPVILAIEDGLRSGQVKIKVESEGKVNTFNTLCRISDSAEQPKYKLGDTRRTYYVDGLEAGKYYSFQVSATNPAGESGWSAEQAFLVR